MSPAGHPAAELNGKKLAILVSAPPERPNFRHALGLARAANSHGVQVYLYLLDDAVNGLPDGQLRELSNSGVNIRACAHAIRKRNLPTGGGMGLSEFVLPAGLIALNDFILGADKFVSFN